MKRERNDYSSIQICDHGYERLKERNGWSKKTAKRMINKVYLNGKHPDELKGYLKQWFLNKGRYESEIDEYIVYGDYMYVFKNKVLITAYNIPCRERIKQIYKKRGY